MSDLSLPARGVPPSANMPDAISDAVSDAKSDAMSDAMSDAKPEAMTAEDWLDLMDEPALLLAEGAPPRASAAWRRACPEHACPSAIEALEPVLPGLCAALASVNEGAEDGPDVSLTTAMTPLPLGADAAWEARARRLPDGRLLVRLRDRRERVQALQRQLDDREQLLFTSRVISVGEMATTLAHELNQPIGAASNLMRGLRMRLSRRTGSAAMTPQEAAALDQSIEQLMFASRVIARVREFTHSRRPRQQLIDLAALARESAALLDWDLQRGEVRLRLELPPAPVQVRGDATMLQQVLVNLMRNALDAMRQSPPRQPLLTVTLSHDAGASDATLTVRDNGCGLSDDAESRLFVPFNSTKPSGMGVGLAICRSFVELHQGRLWFSRNDDRGCSFHVDLPVAAASGDGQDDTASTTMNTTAREMSA